LLGQAVILDGNTYGPNSPNVAEGLEALSDVFADEGKLSEAESTLKSLLAISEIPDGSQAVSNSYYLGKLAKLASRQQRFAQAEQIEEQILAVQNKDQGGEDTATLRDLAEIYHLAKDYPNSEAVFRKIIGSRSLPPGSGELLGAIEGLSAVYEEEGKFEQEEALYQNALRTSEKALPHGHLDTIAELNDLGLFYERRDRLQDAETYYRRALANFVLTDSSLGDSNLATVIDNYARVLRSEGRLDESDQYESLVKAIRDKLGANRVTK